MISKNKTGRIFFFRYLSMMFDAMDQKKCSIPHFANAPKSWVDSSDKVQMQFGAFLIHGHGARCIAWDDRLKKDANLWATALLEILKDLRKEYEAKGKQWPHTLYLQCDNAADNKNLVMYTVCQILRDKGIFKKVKLSFLPVGHTHEDVDACFGALSRKLQHADAPTLAHMEKLWKEAWKGLEWFKYVEVSFFFLLK